MNSTKCEVRTWDLESQFELVAKDKILMGEQIVAERPFISIAVKDITYSSAAWSLVIILLQSPDLLSTYNSLTLKISEFPLDAQDKIIMNQFSKAYGVSKETIKKIYFSVGTNNAAFINLKSEVMGFGIYPMLSRSNHSCMPNAKYAAANLEHREAALISLRDIEPGESITWSYIRGGLFFNSDYKARKLALLQNFQFVCRCDRCLSESSSTK